jgi:hypothetical protein
LRIIPPILALEPALVFSFPRTSLVLLGLLGYGIPLPGLTIAGVNFDALTLLHASVVILKGKRNRYHLSTRVKTSIRWLRPSRHILNHLLPPIISLSRWDNTDPSVVSCLV